MRRLSSLLVVVAIGVGISFVSWFQVQAVQQPLQSIPLDISQATNLTCTQLMTQVMSRVETNCVTLSRNKVCYANPLVNAELTSNSAQQKFDVPGDILPIQLIKTLHTTPLNITRGTWGVSLLKLQANLPDTLP